MQRLRYLAGTYFHQDYDTEAPTPLGVVEMFRADETDQAVAELLTDIETAISGDRSDEALEEIWLRQCGAMYDPGTDGLTFREWFESMRSALG